MLEEDGSTQATSDDGLQSSLEVAVPGIPAAVPSLGMRLLDDWAYNSATKGPHGAWLAPFLEAHKGKLTEAMLAADFLQCQEFLMQASDALLLFLVTARDEVLSRMAQGQRPSKELQLAADFAALPYLSAAVAGCHISENSDDCATSAHGTTRVAVATARPTPAARQGASSLLGFLLGGMERQPASTPKGATSRCVTPQQLEALVEGIDASGMLPRAVNRDDIRACLLHVGFRPRLEAGCSESATVSSSRRLYLSLELPLGAMRGYRAAVVKVAGRAHDQGWSDFRNDHRTYNNSWTFTDLELAEVRRRQANQSRQPRAQPAAQPPAGGADAGAAAAGSSALQAPGDPAAAGAADGVNAVAAVLYKEGRAWTNLHAVDQWQDHSRVYEEHSDLVKALNQAIAAAEASWPAGCTRASGAAAGTASGRGAGSSADGPLPGGQSQPSAGAAPGAARSASSEPPANPTEDVAAASGNADEVQGWRLDLFVVAMFPGWRHFVEGAVLAVELAPR